MSEFWKCVACGASNTVDQLQCHKCGVAGERLSAKQQAERTLSISEKSQFKFKFECAKCSCDDFEVGQLRGKGGLFSALFNFNNTRFYYISCKACGFTEFYKRDLSGGQKALDLFTG